MFLHFFQKAKKLGYEYVDMDPIFHQHYARNRKKFEFKFDGHWNTLGHQVVASSIMETDLWSRFSIKGKDENV